MKQKKKPLSFYLPKDEVPYPIDLLLVLVEGTLGFRPLSSVGTLETAWDVTGDDRYRRWRGRSDESKTGRRAELRSMYIKKRSKKSKV